MYCINCGNQLSTNSKYCSNCGNETLSKNLASEKSPVHKKTAPIKQSQTEIGFPSLTFYSVSLPQLAFLSFFTVGLFEIYWFIKNWELIRKQENLNISSFWRGVFSIFYCYPLFKKILTSANDNGYNTTPSSTGGMHAFFYIILTIIASGIGRAEFPPGEGPFYFFMWAIFCILSIIPILMIQKAINFNNYIVTPNIKVNEKFSGGETTLIIIGVILFMLTSIGYFSNL